MKKTLALLLALACLFTLTACNKQPAAQKKDTFTIMTYGATGTLDPTAPQFREYVVMHALYNGLVMLGKDGSPVPQLAESWTENADEMSITFKLRKDVVFHDGSKMTADDVIYTYERLVGESYHAYSLAEFIASFEKIDDYTVKLIKATPYAKVLEFMIEYFWVVPKAAHSKDPAAFETNPIGCGPYTFVSKGTDSAITLKAFKDYYRGAPDVPNVVVKPPFDMSTAIVSLETGELDMVIYVPLLQTGLVEGKEGLSAVIETESWSMKTLLQLSETLKNDVNLRRAIYHGVNRQNAIDLANEGLGVPAENLFSKRVMGDLAGAVPMVGYDDALAREYLAKSNYKAGDKLTLSFFGDQTLPQSIQSDLKKIGIEIELEQLDVTGWLAKLGNGELEMTIADMGIMYGAVENALSAYTAEDTAYGINMEQLPGFEEAVAQMKVTTDKEARLALGKQALTLLYESGNCVNLYDSTLAFIYNSKDFVYDLNVSASNLDFYVGEVKYAK